MEIIFVTGKGGVGKSAVAAALAMQKAQSGQKTLLVELGRESFYQNGLNFPEVGYQAVPWRGVDHLSVALWSGQDCLREYLIYLLKIESLYKLFFENPVTKTLIQIAPALPELSIMGKVTSGIRHVGPSLNYDTIVVDAFASGHFLALLRAPRGLAEAIKFGPMGEQARSIDLVLKNSSICKYVVVAFPEELPVTEGLELAGDIEQAVGQKPILVMNRYQKISPSALQEKPQAKALLRFQKHLAQIDQRQKELLNTLKQTTSPVVLPQIFEVDFAKVVSALAAQLPPAMTKAVS